MQKRGEDGQELRLSMERDFTSLPSYQFVSQSNCQIPNPANPLCLTFAKPLCQPTRQRPHRISRKYLSRAPVGVFHFLFSSFSYLPSRSNGAHKFLLLRYEPFIAHRGGKNRWLSFGDATGGIFDCKHSF